MNYPETHGLYQGRFTDGNPVAGIPASVASAKHMNMIYDELITLIEGAGVTPDETKQNQVLEAINTLRKDELYDKATDYLATQGRKNILINGKPQVWQNGESFTATGYTADQWYTVLSGATCIKDPDPRKGMLVTVNSADGYGQFHQLIESLEVKKLQGRTLTFSVEYAVNATFSGELRLEVFYSNSSDLETEVKASVAAKHFTPTPSASGIESLTFDVPNDAVGLRVALLTVTGQSVGSEMALYDAQLELGNLPTPFEYSPYVDELRRCCRYFYESESLHCTHHYKREIGPSCNADVYFPVPMRIRPSIIPIFLDDPFRVAVWGGIHDTLYKFHMNSGDYTSYIKGYTADARL
ncbi:hypothetical protein [Marinomonas transparens]|uniref:Uncharacterized protein n=1 Tax=Marinomonas transparens TaxID=2795388 RepID=A0A934JMI6_9GAMM|nr:hypothetical protein [Marinomonas transparens]MBJ7537148.1 hypothetical protein [Marinomonas transparens]